MSRRRAVPAAVLASLLVVSLVLIVIALVVPVHADQLDCGTVFAAKSVTTGESFVATFNNCSAERLARRNQALVLAVVSIGLGLALARVAGGRSAVPLSSAWSASHGVVQLRRLSPRQCRG